MKNNYSTFVIRIWNGDDESKFRGAILHTKTQDKKNFGNIEEMNKFIMEHLVSSSNNFPQFPKSPENHEK